MQYVGFWKRLLAYIIDILPITLLVFAFYFFFLDFDQMLRIYLNEPGHPFARTEFLVQRNQIRDIAGMVWLIYGFVMDCLKYQGTFGKQLLNIRVTSVDGKRLTVGQSAIRTVMKIVGAVVLMLGYIWAGFRSDKAAWHDLAAKSRVTDRLAA